MTPSSSGVITISVAIASCQTHCRSSENANLESNVQITSSNESWQLPNANLHHQSESTNEHIKSKYVNTGDQHAYEFGQNKASYKKSHIIGWKLVTMRTEYSTKTSHLVTQIRVDRISTYLHKQLLI